MRYPVNTAVSRGGQPKSDLCVPRSRDTKRCFLQQHCDFFKSLGIGRTEGNVLFNDAFNTYNLHMVKDHTDNERGSPLSPHRLLFPITDRITHTTAFAKPALAGTRNSLMGPP